MSNSCSSIEIIDEDFILCAQLVSWDSEVFGFPVAQINRLTLSRNVEVQRLYSRFEEWRNSSNVQLVSCRLPQDHLRESIFIEQKGFRFIEMILHPYLEKLDSLSFQDDTITISEASNDDIPLIQVIAESAFSFERFHVDPRLHKLSRGGARYSRWVKHCCEDEHQILYKIEEKGQLIGFFIVEIINEVSAYWHLTAIAPEFHGLGFGKRAWLAMLKHHVDERIYSVSTAISARNTPVLNLYSQLNFHFHPAEMTFHWVRD